MILPTRDRGEVLSRAVESVLGQTYRDLELIVVDDGSVRPALALLEGLGDERIRHLRLDRGCGPAAARNRGLDLVRGRWVAFQDSDDVWEPDKLRQQTVSLNRGHQPADVVYSDMTRMQADGGTAYHQAPEIVDRRLVDEESGFYSTYMIGIQTAVIRRSCLDVVGGFDERLRSLVDLDLFLRLARRSRMERIAQPLVRYFATTGSVASDGSVEIESRRYLLDKYSTELMKESPDFVSREREALRRLGGDPSYGDRSTLVMGSDRSPGRSSSRSRAS